MTIAAIWKSGEVVYGASDTRIVSGESNSVSDEITSKIFSIQIVVHEIRQGSFVHLLHYRNQLGFIYAGSALPATMTAIMSSTLLQNLTRAGDRVDPPSFEEISELVSRLAKRFMSERRTYRGSGIFQAGLFGWCPRSESHRVAFIDGRDDAGTFRVELSYPPEPDADDEPWLVIGGAREKFNDLIIKRNEWLNSYESLNPIKVIRYMINNALDDTVGGSISIGMAHRLGFQLCYSCEPHVVGSPEARTIFNGLDIDRDIGKVGPYGFSFWGVT